MCAFTLYDRYSDPGSGRFSSYFCKLFILAGEDFLQYCVLDTEKNVIIAVADYRIEAPRKNQEIYYSSLHQLFSDDEILTKKYPSVVFGSDSLYHTLVPLSLFEPEKVSEYLAFNFRLPGDVHFLADHIEEFDAYNLSAIPSGLKELINRHYPGANLVHGSTALIKALYHHSINSPGEPRLYLHVRHHFIDLAFFEGNRPYFFNSFQCAGKEDVLYFTINMIEQLSRRADQVQLFLSGLIVSDDEINHLLGQYIRNISFSGSLNMLNFKIQPGQMPSHRFQELFGLTLCGS